MASITFKVGSELMKIKIHERYNCEKKIVSHVQLLSFRIEGKREYIDIRRNRQMIFQI